MGLTHMGLWGLEKVGIVPAGTQDVVQRMKVSGDALVRGGQAKVSVPFTTMFCAIARKKLTPLPYPISSGLHADVFAPSSKASLSGLRSDADSGWKREFDDTMVQPQLQNELFPQLLMAPTTASTASFSTTSFPTV